MKIKKLGSPGVYQYKDLTDSATKTSIGCVSADQSLGGVFTRFFKYLSGSLKETHDEKGNILRSTSL